MLTKKKVAGQGCHGPVSGHGAFLLPWEFHDVEGQGWGAELTGSFWSTGEPEVA